MLEDSEDAVVLDSATVQKGLDPLKCVHSFVFIIHSCAPLL